MNSYFNSILPKLGYNRHMPSAVVYAPTHFGGIGLSDMTTEQGLAHVMIIIGHMRAKSDIATTITALETYMITTGTITNPLQDHHEYHYVTAPWIEKTKTFLSLTNTTIDTPAISHSILLRQRDRAIMAIATKCGHTNAQMIHINACRLWLQVTTLADINDISGTNLLKPALTGESDHTYQPVLWTITSSKMHWPLQEKPGKQSWKAWRQLIRRLLHPQSLELKSPLDKWNQNWDKQRA
jgi:hypothetical protein